jgi:hypothetical protein
MRPPISIPADPDASAARPRNIIEPVKDLREIPPLRNDVRLRLRERFSALKAELERLRFETDRRWEELLARLSENPEEILPEELLRAPAEPRPVRGGTVSLSAARRLDGAHDQVEVLSRFLEECRRHASRAALLVERNGGMRVWKRAGFDGAADDRRDAAVPEDDALARVREGSPQALPAGNSISAALGAGDAVAAVLLPFPVRESVSGAVYADTVAEARRAFDPEAIALLTWLAGLAVDRLAARKLVPSPALRPFEGESPTAADQPPSFASAPPPGSPAAPLPREEPASGAEGRGRVGGPLAPSRDDDRRNEARRFARLLASEIKLYNEGAVREGRERGNLYFRLREDIERGRRLYEERVPADVRSNGDYYYEELVEVLAEGRPETLGMR